MSDFAEAVRTAFAALIARGTLRAVAERYDAERFGNAFVVLAGGNLRVRLVRDRGQLYAEAAGADGAEGAEDWAPLERVLRAVGIADAPAEGEISPAAAAALVARYWRALTDGFSPRRRAATREKLAALARERATAVLQGLRRS